MASRRVIPTARKCFVCGCALTLAQTHYAELSHGYARMRGGTEGGGVNAVKLPTWTGRFFCEWCLLKHEEGVQLDLFGGPDDG